MMTSLAMRLCAGLLLWAALGWGQGGFLISVREGETTRQIANGATVEFASKIGQGKDIFVEIQYLGVFRGELGEPAFTGSADFRLVAAPPMPTVLQTREKVVLQVRFEPAKSERTLAQLAVTARELPPEGSNLQPGGYGLLLAGFSGTAPEIQYAFALGVDGNLQPLADGGTIRFLKAPVNQVSLATVLVINRGTAPATVDSASLAGAEELDLIQLPLLPLTLGAGQSVQFRIRYQPKDVGVHEATLRLSAEGAGAVVRVAGASQGPKWAYEVAADVGGGDTARLAPDGVADFGEVELGKRKRLWIRVRNTGNEEGVLGVVAVSGAGFALVDPPLAQTVVKAGGEVWFGVSVTGVEAGRQTGRLRVGTDTFLLTAMAVGAVLEYSYVAGGVTVVGVGGQVLAPPAAIGQTTAVLFVVENKGNRRATIVALGVSGAGKAFRVAGAPQLPVTLEPEQRVEFLIEFTPLTPGLNTAVLGVGTAFFNLAGNAAALPELPGYRWEGASGTVAPMSQTSVGLRLASPYPVTLRGALAMTVDSASFGADAAVQFSTGGRAVSFIIPAGETRAVFANGSTSVRLQTGTSAGRIVLTPSFVTDGGIVMTPDRPAALELTVPEQAPVVLAARLEASLSAVNVVVTGYSTTRSLTKMEVTIKRRTGKTETFTFDVSQAAQLWFGSAGSLSTGGLFSATAPFTVLGSTDDRNKLLEELEGVTVKVTNERGTSAEFSTPTG